MTDAGTGGSGFGRRVAIWLGILTFLGAIGAALLQAGELGSVFGAVAAHPAELGLLFVLPVVCLSLAASSFWVLMTRFGRVGLPEMFALLGAAWLLNYLPLKPGVAGRVAYHKAVNEIGVRQSVVVVAQTVAIGAACFVIQFIIAVVATRSGASERWVAAALGAPLAVAGLCAGALPRKGALQHAWRYAASFSIRYADSLVWALRYGILFDLAGRPMGIGGSAVLASVSQSASLLPLAGNGLGVREWAVGLAAHWMPGWSMTPADLAIPVAFGISTELVNRVAEATVAVPVGLMSIGWLARRVRQARKP
jgi:hypothetical protein